MKQISILYLLIFFFCLKKISNDLYVSSVLKYAFYEDFKKNEETLNIQFAAQHLKKPYLIVHGTNDEAVKSKTADLLHNWVKNSELLIVQDANHTFGGKEPWNEPILPIHLQEVIEYCTRFLKNIG